MKTKRMIILAVAMTFTACKKEVETQASVKDCDCDRVISTPYFSVTGQDGISRTITTITTVNECSGVEKTQKVTTSGPLGYKYGDCRYK
jgi:hypothetical protein